MPAIESALLCHGRCPRPCLLYSAAARDEAGGVQAVFRRLADDLRRTGVPTAEGWSGPGPARDLGDGVFVRPLLIEFSGGLWRLPGTLWRAGIDLAGLARDLRRSRPAVVNLHYVRGEALYFLLLRPWFRYRLMLSFHGSDLLRPSALSRRLLPFFIRRADAVTVVSKHQRDLLLEQYGRSGHRLPPVFLIPNGIDLGFWSAPEDSIDVDAASRGPVVLFAGRLEPVKGLDVLLRAFASAAAAVPGLRLEIAGDGSLRVALERQAEALGVAAAVDWCGEVSPAALRRRLHQAAVFVLPSRSEGMPLALIEAMATGCACIASRVGGVPELLSEGAGLLVAPEDVQDLTRALMRLLTDPALATGLGRAAKRRATRFSAEDSDRAYRQLLAGLIQ